MIKKLNNPIVSGLLAAVAIGLVLVRLLPDPHSLRQNDSEIEDIFDFDGEMDDLGPPTAFDPDAIHALATASPQRDILSRQLPVAIAGHTEASPEKRYESESVSVQGIWIQGQSRIAAIDAISLREGQYSKRARVDRIETGGVWLRVDHETRYLQPGQSWTYQYEKVQAEAHN